MAILLALLLVAFQSPVVSPAIRYLPVSAFDKVPKKVAAALKSRGCSIPQASGKQPNNIVSGSFAHKGQKDWAAVCSVKGESRIVVLWGGKHRCASESVSVRDIDSLMDGAYARMLSTASPEQIIRYAKQYRRDLGSPIEHDGLDDGFSGKASVVRFCDSGLWQELQGAD